jgi:hypothetical protein
MSCAAESLGCVAAIGETIFLLARISIICNLLSELGSLGNSHELENDSFFCEKPVQQLLATKSKKAVSDCPFGE